MKTGMRGLLPQSIWIALSIILLARFVFGQIAITDAQPPIPKPDALAQPRSPGQAGFPVNQTRAAIPPDNPQTPEKVALGEKLFFDGRLSADGTVACASCHNPDLAFTDRRPTSVGIRGRVGHRNAPTLLNVLFNQAEFWDGRAPTLEEQASLSITNSVEMGQPSMDAAVASIAAIDDYKKAFHRVFGRPPSGPNLLRAIAAYELTLYSFNAPFDHFLAGDKNAISDSAKRGWALFNGQASCNRCHAITIDQPNFVNFTDNDFHDTGIGIVRYKVVPLARRAEQLVDSGDKGAIDRAAIQTDMSSLGRFLITRQEIDIASFKTPGLRNVLVTAPYFHDGSQETLWDVMDHYNKGGGPHDPFIDEAIQPLALREQDIDDLVAFLASLTSPEYAEQGAKELERQRALSKISRPLRDTVRAFGPKPSIPPMSSP